MDALHPLTIVSPTPAALQWFESVGGPVYVEQRNAKHNLLAFARRLGYWPEPFFCEKVRRLKDIELNDPIPF